MQIWYDFQSLSWGQKIEYLTTFYQAMIDKTMKPTHKQQFVKILSVLYSYEQSDAHEQALVWLYDKILAAQEQSKARKIAHTASIIAQNTKKLHTIYNNDDEADVFLTEALMDIDL